LISSGHVAAIMKTNMSFLTDVVFGSTHPTHSLYFGFIRTRAFARVLAWGVSCW